MSGLDKSTEDNPEAVRAQVHPAMQFNEVNGLPPARYTKKEREREREESNIMK